jgi:curved DNA-binding protein CbpA
MMLKQKLELPSCFQVLGFDKIPENKDQLKARYRQLARIAHPDSGGNFEKFVRLRKAFEDSIKLLEQKGGQQ